MFGLPTDKYLLPWILKWPFKWNHAFSAIYVRTLAEDRLHHWTLLCRTSYKTVLSQHSLPLEVILRSCKFVCLKKKQFCGCVYRWLYYPASWVNRPEYFSVSASNRAPVPSNVFLIENAAFDVTGLFQRRKHNFELFRSRSIVDFENNKTPETTFYICYDIYHDIFLT
jgi:hypothetical protein